MFQSGLTQGVIAVAAFGLTLPFTRIAVLATSAWDVYLTRLLLAAAVAAVVIIWRRTPVPPRDTWSRFAIVIGGVVIGFPLFTALAMHSEGAAHGGVILGVLPLGTAAAGALLNRERPSGMFWWMALLGTALVVVFASTSTDGGAGLGDFHLVLAVISASLGYAAGASLAGRMPAWQVISWALAVSLPVALLLLPSLNLDALFAHRSAGEQGWLWLSLLYVGLISQYGGFLLWYRALSLDGVARTSQIQLIQPFFTLLGAALLLGESITLRALVFATLVLMTVVLSRRASVRTLPSEAA